MKSAKVIQAVAVWLAVVGFCLPQAALAVPPSPQTPAVADVALQKGGVLYGQVVTPQGSSLANVPVSLRVGDQMLGQSTTNGSGYFAFRGLHGGVYQIVAAEGHGAYRLWAPDTAPPVAQEGALVVSGGETVRGNFGGRMKFWLCNPWVIAGIVATAIAVPVAIHNCKDDKSP